MEINVEKTSTPHGFTSCKFSRHGIAQASLALLIWLNENFRLRFRRKLTPTIRMAGTKTLDDMPQNPDCSADIHASDICAGVA